MAMGIFEQLTWLTTRVKRLCCAVEQIQQSGAGSYRVYTALLTQSGGDDFTNFGSDNPLPFVIGATYEIAQNDDNGDFTNIGAPNNNVGTFFVATGTTPASWGNNPGLGGVNVNYNAGAPVVTVLENTIGNIWFTYTGVGDYSINSDGLFENLKTYYSILSISDTATQQRNGLFVINTNQIGISSGDGNIYENGYLFRTPIEIRVYN
jgi:hypothetical protein